MMDRKALILLIFLSLSLALSLAVPQSSPAVVCPDTASLGKISNLGDAHWAAVDEKGNVYVVQNTPNKITVFSPSGRLLKTVTHQQPLGIAIDSDGIYVTDLYRNLTIYDRAFNVRSTVFIGVRQPLIAVSPDRIYISDPNYYRVRMYSKAGQYIGSTYGNGDTFVPIGMFVEPSTGNLYVVNDVPPSVQVFDADGNFITKFVSSAWDGTGVLGHAVDIHLDSQGRAFISDSLQANINVFDSATGTYLCSFVPFESLRIPSGMAMGANGLLYVTDKERSAVYIFGVDNYVKMDVSPSSLSFSGPDCGAKLPSQTLNIANSGRGTLDWSVSSDSAWITASSVSGQLAAGASVDIAIEVNPSGLGAGTRTGVITVASADGTEEKVSISLDVTAPAALAVEPQSFTFSVRGNDIPAAETLTVEISGDVTDSAMWSAASDSWLNVTPSSGSSNTLTMASVSLNLDGLSGGSYEGSITVSADCATGSPVVVPVSLTYVKGGTINVTANIPEASYTISGPETYSGSGMSFTASAAPEGTYTITFADVKGYKAPASYSQAVANGSTTEFVGNYKFLGKKMGIIASVGSGSDTATEEVRIFAASGSPASSFVVDGRAGLRGGTTTASGDIDGDGKAEIITASGKDGSIAAYSADGTPLTGGRFSAFMRFGAEVATGDLDGDGVMEIIAGAAPQSGNPAEVRVFNYVNGSVVDTGINFIAHADRNGVMVASGDIDGDGKAEIITAQGGSVRIWRANTLSGARAWKASDSSGFAVSGAISSIAVGDIDGDGVSEIIIAMAPPSGAKSVAITAYRADGTQIRTFSIDSKQAVSIAVGDTDLDGAAEIAVTDSGKSRTPSRVRVYDAMGALKSEFNAFESRGIIGIRVSMGEVGQ